MVKRIISLLLLILVLTTSPVFAANSKVFDEAQLISPTNIEEVKQKIDDINSKYQVPVVIYTTNEQIINARERADALLADQAGVDKDGLILYINMNTGDYHISYSGRVLNMINDNRRDSLKDNVLDGLVSGDYEGAINTFINESEGYIAGGEIAGNKLVPEQGVTPQDVAMAGTGGLGTFLMSYFGLKNGAKLKPSSLSYNLNNNTSFVLGNLADQFITTRTTARRIPRVVTSSGGRGGSFTTTHKGPGGGTFGGGGGKFK